MMPAADPNQLPPKRKAKKFKRLMPEVWALQWNCRVGYVPAIDGGSNFIAFETLKDAERGAEIQAHYCIDCKPVRVV